MAAAIVACCALSLLAISSLELIKTVRFIDITYVFQAFDRNDRRIESVLEEYSVNAMAVISEGECRSDILAAAVGIVLARLDRIDPDSEFDRWIMGAERAKLMLEHATTCAPAVSDFWLRLALVNRAAGEIPLQQAELIKRALDLDPSSLSGLRSRFTLWRKLSDASLDAARKSLDKDVKTLLNYAPPGSVRELLLGSGKVIQKQVISEFEKLSFERKRKLISAKALPHEFGAYENL